MVARSEIKLEVGMILVHIKTGQFWTIYAKSRPMAWRNSGGSTNKKSHRYTVVNNKNEKHSMNMGRGDLLNQFRVLETPAEIVLYGRKDV